uniref:Uncharacterized protein n=2 Tax=Parascaris univalens TaxID=6257 RepID=A0A915B6C6_PARUN
MVLKLAQFPCVLRSIYEAQFNRTVSITKPSMCPMELLLSNHDDSKTFAISTRRKQYNDIRDGQCLRVIDRLKKDGSFQKSYGHQARFCSTLRARMSAHSPQDETAVLKLSPLCGVLGQLSLLAVSFSVNISAVISRLHKCCSQQLS